MEFMYCNFQEPSFEDDLYYAELERQILLLTADDEDLADKDRRYGSVLGGKTPLPLSPTRHASSDTIAAVGTDFMMWENYSNHRGSAGMGLRQKSKGTGVFIPKTINSQTSLRSSGRMYYGRRMKRQMEYKNHDTRSAFKFQ